MSSNSHVQLTSLHSSMSKRIAFFVVHPGKADALLVAHTSHCLALMQHENTSPGVNQCAQRMRSIPLSCEATGRVKRSLPECDESKREANDPAKSKRPTIDPDPYVKVEFVVKAGTACKADQEGHIPAMKTPEHTTQSQMRRTGKRKLSTLKDKPISQYKKMALNSDQFDSLIQTLPLTLKQSDPFWDMAESIGLYQTPTQAEKSLTASLDTCIASASKVDQRTAEHAALRYLWMGKYAEASDLLFAHHAMSGEFLPFFIPAGRLLYQSVVQRYVTYLQSVGETHLAAMHLMSLGETARAVKTYQEAYLHDDAVCLAGIKFIKEDPRLQEAFSARGRHQTMEAGSSFESGIFDLLIGNKYDEALQVRFPRPVRLLKMSCCSCSSLRELQKALTLP